MVVIGILLVWFFMCILLGVLCSILVRLDSVLCVCMFSVVELVVNRMLLLIFILIYSLVWCMVIMLCLISGVSVVVRWLVMLLSWCLVCLSCFWLCIEIGMCICEVIVGSSVGLLDGVGVDGLILVFDLIIDGLF